MGNFKKLIILSFIFCQQAICVQPQKKALIIGITGQDGSYLTELLLAKSYQVHGVVRRASSDNLSRLSEVIGNQNLFLHYGDLVDGSVFSALIKELRPDEVYNLGAQSDVKISFEVPEYTGDVTGLGTLRILEAIRQHSPQTRFYQASSSEMFGKALPPQSEKTSFIPCSPYAAAKLYAYWITVNYRQSYGLFACNGILFNHESPRRGTNFVTRKITTSIANILAGKQKKIYLGNLSAQRDWGFAPDYVEAMWLMLQQENPDDFVIGTGESHSVREFAEKAFAYAGVQIGWIGQGIDEKGIAVSVDQRWQGLIKKGDVLLEVEPKFFRPSEVEFLQADSTKAFEKINWKPKITFEKLVQIMMETDLSNFFKA